MVFLSVESFFWFRLTISTVMPPSMLDAPGKAAWPPLLTAKGHVVRRAISTRPETSRVVLGLNVQWGSTSSCCIDQYVVGAALDTLAAPKTSLRELHFPKLISGRWVR